MNVLVFQENIVEFVFEGMICVVCVVCIEKGFNKMLGVMVVVNFVSEKVQVCYSGVVVEDLFVWVEKIGYKVSVLISVMCEEEKVKKCV